VSSADKLATIDPATGAAKGGRAGTAGFVESAHQRPECGACARHLGVKLGLMAAVVPRNLSIKAADSAAQTHTHGLTWDIFGALGGFDSGCVGHSFGRCRYERRIGRR
jgi:hypothetical protein